MSSDARNRRVIVVGWDCAPPALVFDRWREALPNVAQMMRRGTWGPLRSTVPPITVPAWTCMVSGRDPGELGLYGFRNREPDGYGLRVADARDVRVKRVWDWLGESGRRVAPLFVPPTYPPTPVRGAMASCFLTPGPGSTWTFPPRLGDRLERDHGPYEPDVADFRADEPERVLTDLHRLADQHFAMARDVLETEEPDFLMYVEMGPDRLHHAMWQHLDPAHPRYVEGNRFEHAAREYYATLDAHLGRLGEAAGPDATVLLVSDHGARSMRGGVRVNEWLARQGWLVLRERPDVATRLADVPVDWGATRAWGEGGYYARIFLNVRGREPQGVVEARDYERERDRLAEELAALRGPDGEPLEHRIVRPDRHYRRARGVPPDLMVFFGDLALRSIGTVGGEEGVHVESNDTGPDACNHDWDGIFAMAGGGAPASGRLDDLSIYDVAPTILGLMGAPRPPGLLGRDRSGGSAG